QTKKHGNSERDQSSQGSTFHISGKHGNQWPKKVYSESFFFFLPSITWQSMRVTKSTSMSCNMKIFLLITSTNQVIIKAPVTLFFT
ncbi:hypothetical protein VIGAN_02246000, partial [Vigna angularis var. angularis]